MYNFEKRLEDILKSFSNLKRQKNNPNRKNFEHHLNNTIILARSLTISMQKDLSHREGFKQWYAPKVKEMKENFDIFRKRRNQILKDGTSILGNNHLVKIGFSNLQKDPTAKIVAWKIGKDNTRKPVYGHTEHVSYFKESNEKEINVIDPLTQYIDYLKDLVSEAKKKFKEKI